MVTNAHLAVVDGAEDCEDEEGQQDVDADLQPEPALLLQRKRRGRTLQHRSITQHCLTEVFWEQLLSAFFSRC